MKKLLLALVTLTILAAGAAWGVRLYLRQQVERDLTARLAAHRDQVAVTYAELEPHLNQSLTLRGVTVALPGKEPMFRLACDRVTSLSPDAAGYQRLQFAGCQPTSPSWIDLGAPELGYDPAHLQVRGEIEFRQEEQGRLLDLRRLILEVPEAGRLEANLRAGGLGLDLLGPAMALRLAFLTLHRAHFQYSDASLANRLLEYSARESGLEPQPYRELAIAETTRRLDALAAVATSQEGRDKIDQLRQALAAFIYRPGILSLDVSPASPLPLAEILGFPPTDMVVLLNLTVSHQAAASSK